MAAIKDYYKILNVKPASNINEIKIAYRRLAMKYHPDRNPDDALAAAVFSDLAEANKVLSNAKARKQYNYERHITATQEYQRLVETMESLIFRINKINKQIKNSDPFHFNKDALLYSIKQLFPDDMDLLLHTDDTVLKQFLEEVCLSVEKLSSPQTKQVISFLQPLYKKHLWLQQCLNELLHRQQKEERWEKSKIALAFIIAIILCIIIFLAARK